MTIHSAKGLEFPYVFVVGMEEGVFPHSRSLYANDELEEERRLCYVAITRAKEKLWLLGAKRRTLYGMDNINPISRFVKEIEEEHLDSGDTFEEKSPSTMFKKGTIDDSIEYACGEKVVHSEFGEGVIVSVDKTILTIAFPHPYGIKKIMKGHKSIRKV